MRWRNLKLSSHGYDVLAQHIAASMHDCASKIAAECDGIGGAEKEFPQNGFMHEMEGTKSLVQFPFQWRSACALAMHHFPFDLVPLDFLAVDFGVLLVSSDLVEDVVGVDTAGVGYVVAGVEGEAGVDVVESVGVVADGVPAAVVIGIPVPGVVAGGSGFLNGSSQVCRT